MERGTTAGERDRPIAVGPPELRKVAADRGVASIGSRLDPVAAERSAPRADTYKLSIDLSSFLSLSGLNLYLLETYELESRNLR